MSSKPKRVLKKSAEFYLKGINEYLINNDWTTYFKTPEEFYKAADMDEKKGKNFLCDAYNAFVVGIKPKKGPSPAMDTFGYINRKINKPSTISFNGSGKTQQIINDILNNNVDFRTKNKEREEQEFYNDMIKSHEKGVSVTKVNMQNKIKDVATNNFINTFNPVAERLQDKIDNLDLSEEDFNDSEDENIISTKTIDKEGQEILNNLNKWGIQKGYTPLFKTFDDYKRKIKKVKKPIEAKEQLQRTYNYFVNSKKSKGTAPNKTTYFDIARVEDKTNDLNISKTDFLNNEMSQQVKTFEDFYELTPKVKAKAKAKSGFNNETYRTNYGNAMNRLFETTKSGLKVTHNNKYVNPAYIKDVFLPKHQGWTYRNDEDLDGDEINDVALYDDKNNLRIFNGYQFGPKNYMMEYQNYLQNPKTTDFGFKSGFLPSRPKKNKTEKPYADTVKIFVDATYNKFKELIKSANNYALTMTFNNSGFKSKLTGYINHYVALPFILFGSNGYEVNEEYLRSLIFAEKGSDEYWAFLKLCKSKKLKELMVEYKELINQAIGKIEEALFKIIDDKKVAFIKSFLTPGNDEVPKLFYNVTIEFVNKTYNKGFQKI